MRTNEGIPEPSESELADPANYKVEDAIYPGDEDDPDDRQVGDGCIELVVKRFVVARFFGPRRRRLSAIFMKKLKADFERGE